MSNHLTFQILGFPLIGYRLKNLPPRRQEREVSALVLPQCSARSLRWRTLACKSGFLVDSLTFLDQTRQ